MQAGGIEARGRRTDSPGQRHRFTPIENTCGVEGRRRFLMLMEKEVGF